MRNRHPHLFANKGNGDFLISAIDIENGALPKSAVRFLFPIIDREYYLIDRRRARREWRREQRRLDRIVDRIIIAGGGKAASVVRS
jgi:hypothetical protein